MAKIARLILVLGLLGTLSFHPAPPAEVEETVSEADFRANDREWCHVNDYWSINVEGLYTMTSGEVLNPGTDGAIRLIEFAVASADADPEPERREAP